MKIQTCGIDKLMWTGHLTCSSSTKNFWWWISWTSILRKAMFISRDPRQFLVTFHFILFCFVRINLRAYFWSKVLSKVTLCHPEIFNLVLKRQLIVLCFILLGMQLSGSIFVHMEPWTIEIEKDTYQFSHSIFLLPKQQLLLSCSQSY